MRHSVSLESLAFASAAWSQHLSANKKQVHLDISPISGLEPAGIKRSVCV